ncbi:MAG: hypothetical protein K4H23_02125 [Mollicutes bacterium PWAP]|nr:hypothetical protein [Mollicutes bacterium PWAP]
MNMFLNSDLSFNTLFKITYEEYVQYLKNKYGSVPKNYFTKNGNNTQGITKTKNGLYIHHVDEDKMILLSK